MEEELSQYYDEELPDPELRNKGVLYEQFVYSLYRDRGMIPQGFLPPKIGGHGVDLKLFMRDYNVNKTLTKEATRLMTGIPFGGDDIGKVVGIELKTSDEDHFGSSALSYDYAKREWILTGRNTVHNEENRKLLKSANALQLINKKWKSSGAPKRFRYKSGNPPTYPKDALEYDKFSFPEYNEPMSGIVNVCSNYYTAKECNYINVSTHGLYYFNKDPLGLSRYGVKRFSSCVGNMGIRFRLKKSGSWNFNVSMIIMGNLQKSSVNLNDPVFADELRDDAAECKNATYALKQYRAMNST